MKLSDFDYTLPRELIVQYPLEERDACRLLVLDRKNQEIRHLTFRDIPEYFRKDDLLVLNDTKVLPARLIGKRVTGGKVEVLLLKRKCGLAFSAMIAPSRVKSGEKIIFTPAPIVKKGQSPKEQLVRGFNGKGSYGIISGRNEITFGLKDAREVYKLGMMPLPPYIKRDVWDSDNTYYQTVYAKNEGAIASPTAGLHFTKKLLKTIESFGVNTAYLTLHVGIGTFKPVKDDDITKHKMEPEYFNIPQNTIDMLRNAEKNNNRIIAVGTTSLRVLETCASGARKGYTDLFIYPGYKFKMADCLLTNFHLPKTTLFMLVCAFAGEKFIKKAYQEAIDNKYRFYSYGDAMLII